MIEVGGPAVESGLAISRWDEFAPTKLERSSFSCGSAELDRWLVEFAGQAWRRRDAVPFLLHLGREICGFYTLSAGSVRRNDHPTRWSRGAPDPIPTFLIGRMAVDVRYQRRGIGSEMLRDAIQRACRSRDFVGARSLHVAAMSREAVAFYEHWGFAESEVSPRLLMLILPIR